jgi:putative transcriptional regulator
MREAYDRIKEGLNEALAFAQGEKTGAIVHTIAVPRVDVAAIRATRGFRRASSPRASALPKGHCSIGSMAAGNRRGQRKCCSP